MKNIRLHFLLLLSILVIVYSCEYSPPEIPLTEVEKPSDQGSIVSVTLSPEKDTLKLSTNVYVSYKVDVGSNEIYDVKFLMDGTDMGTPSSIAIGQYATTLQASKMSDGLHELKIRTYTSTNSGSIADKVGAEQYFYELKWPVLVNKGAKDQMKFTNLQATSNGIKLTWFKYDYADFQRYTVNKISTMPGQSKELVNTTNPSLNSVIDNGYIEGDFVTYSLYTYMDGIVMDFKSYIEEIKKPKVTIQLDRSIEVKWSPSNHSQNVKSYFLKTIIPVFGYTEEKEISDLTQTSGIFNEKIGFGGNYGIQLRYIPKGYESYNTFDVKGGLTAFALGDSIPAFQRGFVIDGTNTLLVYNDGKFFRYNYSTGQSSASFAIAPIESVYQRFIVASASGELFGYLEDKQFVLRKTSDWSLVKKMDIEAYDGFNSNLSTISISNNGIVATVDTYGKLRIFNLPTGTKILEKESIGTQLIQRAVVSPDGKQLCLRYTNYLENKCSLISYTIENGKLNEISRYERVGNDYESSYTYSPISGKLIYFNYLGGYNYKVEILNPQTLAVENTVAIPDWFIPIAYDYSTDRVVGQYQFFPIKRYSYLLDVKTGKLSKMVQFVGQGQYLISNGTAFASNGRSIKIEDYIIP